MVAISHLGANEKEALLIMFGSVWRKRFWALDGKSGRPSLDDCIDGALRKRNHKAQDDLITYVERYLTDIARRCEASARSE